MSEFPKSHGLKIVGNGWIENLNVEKLSADPIITDAGRIWYNSTEKSWKTSVYEGPTNTVTVKTFATKEELVIFITSLASQQNDNSGTKLIGYDGISGTNNRFSLPAGTLKATLDAIGQKLDSLDQGVATAGIAVYDETTLVANQVQELHFIGAGVLSTSHQGKIKIYIPTPDYVSHYNTNDGTGGDATITDVTTTSRYVAAPTSEGTPYKIGNWVGGTQHPTINSGSLVYNTPGKCLFPGIDSQVLVEILDANGTTVLASNNIQNIAGDVTNTSNNITIAITGWETHYDKYRANINVTVSLASILSTGGRFSIRISHITSTDGTFIKSQNDIFYDINNAVSSLGSVSITPGTTPVTKTLSGIIYYTTTSPFDISITNINNINDRSYPQPFINIDPYTEYGISAYDLNGVNITGWTNVYNSTNLNYTGSKTITRTNFRYIGTAANISARTQDWSAGTWVNSPDSNILIDTYGTSSTDINEDFNDEARRITSSNVAWNSSNLLSTSDLMVQNGVLKRQAGNWTGYLPSNTANYTSSVVTQYYYRGFRHANISHSNGRFQLAGVTQANLDNEDIIIWISLDNTNWYKCNDEYLGGVLNNNAGCRINIDSQPLPNLEFTLGTGKSTSGTTGPSGWGIYVKIEMKAGSTVELDYIRIVNW